MIFRLFAGDELNPNLVICDRQHWLARLLLRVPRRYGYVESTRVGLNVECLHFFAFNPYARLAAERKRLDAEWLANQERFAQAYAEMERDLGSML